MKEYMSEFRVHKISMDQDDVEAQIFRTDFNNVNFEYFEL